MNLPSCLGRTRARWVAYALIIAIPTMQPLWMRFAYSIPWWQRIASCSNVSFKHVEKRTAWSTAWGVVGAVFGGGAIAWWVASAPKDSHLAAWPAAVFGVLGLVGLYGVFATLLGIWPFGHLASDSSPTRGLPDHPSEVESPAAGPAERQAGARDVPQLSFGKAMIPTQSHPIALVPPEVRGEPRQLGLGRVARVPVVNAQGAGDATHVHAQLRFQPADREGLYSPRHPAQGEWFNESGSEVELDLPGNGRPHLLDVVVVLNGQYPYAYEWTAASRRAVLRGYAIKANSIEVDIEVMGSGSEPHLPRLQDRLIIRLDPGTIVADWASAGADEATNWVAWDGYSRGAI